MIRRRTLFSALSGLVFVLAAVTWPGMVHGDPVAPGAPAQTPSKVANRVAKMAEAIDGRAEPTSPAELSNPLVHVDPDGRIELAFRSAAPTSQQQEDDLARLGAVGIRGIPAGAPTSGGGLLEAWLPHDELAAAASLSWVTSIAPPAYSRVSAGTVLSEGVAALDAAALHARGINGSGVKVGVISDGVTSLAAAQAAAELPAGVTVVPVNGSSGSGEEGTAMLELVHDMAPGASLYFAPAGETVLTFASALQALAAAGVNVIVHDLAFDTEPVFEQGFVASTIEALSQSSGIAVYAAAGNVGSTHVRVAATGTGVGPDGKAGPFADCAKQPTNAVAIAPSGDTTFDVEAFAAPAPPSLFTLQWSEPSAQILGQGAFTDLDLYILDEALTKCLGQADDVQANGVGDSLEALIGGPATDQNVKVVVNVAGTSSAVTPPTLDLRWRDAAPLDAPSRTSSINPNNNFTSGLPSAVAAIDAVTGQMEPYSGAGPVELFSTTVCPNQTAGPCTGVAGAPKRTFVGPAITGVDNVSVSGAGGFPTRFRGTSAAAPHAGGCDALVRHAIGSPGASIAVIRDRLAAGAVDTAPTGVDPSAGAGLIDCTAAARVSNLSVTATSDAGTLAPGGTVNYTINVKNDGPDESVTFEVVDTLPVGMSFSSAPAGCSATAAAAGASQVVTCPQQALGVGESRSLTLAATASAVPEGTLNLVNQVSVLSPFDITPADNIASVTTVFASAGSTEGGPVVGEPLARTGGDQGNQFWLALMLVAAGACLWAVGSSRPLRARRAADGRSSR